MTELRKKAEAELEKKLEEFKVNNIMHLIRKRNTLEKKIEDLEEEIERVEALTKLPEEGCSY